MDLGRHRMRYGEPTEITGDQERDAFACALQAIEERKGERYGWDQPPRLWALYMSDLSSRMIELFEIPSGEWRDGVLEWASQYPAPGPVTATRFADCADGFVGMAMMHHGRDPRELATLDQVVIRTITAVDINDLTCVVRRPRGGKRETHAYAAGQDSMGNARGHLPRALARLNHAVRTGALSLP
ncbi:hypothetical protein [Streptomyces sp. NPDC051776]|uniref:hypothetical protein n=1 Tax=Streptomyces sp. NPDC051776 TaxID=3155414 RepID=UPI003439BAAA